jgi:Glycosyltransferase family 87
MTGIQTLVARGAVGLLGALLIPFVARISFTERIASRISNRTLLWLFALSRLAIYVLVFGLLRISPRGDIPAFYYPQAISALAGLVPYRDFISSYAPLHSYLDACVVLVWRSPLAIILLAVIAEIGMVVIWSSIAGPEFGDKRIRLALLLYAVSPLSILQVAIDGQNNVIVGLFLALSAWFALKHRRFISGVMYSLSICAVKFLPLIYLPLFVASLRRWSRWVLGFAFTVVAIYGSFAALRAPILQPLTEQSAGRRSGCLPYLIEVLAGFQANGRIWDALLVLALSAVWAKALTSARANRARPAELSIRDSFQLHTFMYGAVAVTLVLLILSKKSWITYSLMTLFPLCVLVAESKWLYAWLFGAFQWIAVVEPSFWASVLLQPESLQLRELLRSRQPAAEAFLGIEVLLIAGYLVFLLLALRRLSRRGVSLQHLKPDA